jgi:hypothetical protein
MSPLENAQLTYIILNALRLSHEIADLKREVYSQDSFYGDEGKWTRDSRVEANEEYFGASIACVSHGTLSSD